MSDTDLPSPPPSSPLPERDRFGRVLRQTLEGGGDPTSEQLNGILTQLQQKISASRAQTVRRVRTPEGELVSNAAASTESAAVAAAAAPSSSVPEPWRAENQRLRAWIVRLWVGTVAALVTCAVVVVYFGMKRADQTATVQPTIKPTDDAPSIPRSSSSVAENKVPPTRSTGSEKGIENGEKPSITRTTAPNSPTAPIEPAKITDNTPPPAPAISTQAPQAPGVEPKVAAPKIPETTPPLASATVPAPAPVEAPAPAAPDVSTEDVIVVVNGEPIIGKAILPATETDFKIKLADTGQVIALRWNSLEESERRRVKKQYGLQDNGGRTATAWGEKVTGARLHFVSGKTMDVLPQPDRDVKGQRAFRTANAPLLMIPTTEIKSEEKIDCFESDFYCRREVYERWLVEKPPGNDDAAAHLELARKTAAIGLYMEALDQLKSAELIDPRTEEPNREFQMEIIRAHARQQTLEIFEKMQRANLTKDYFAAAECLDKLDRNFPNSEFKSRWDALRAGIEAGCKTEVRKRVIQMSYTVALDLIEKQLARRIKVDAKGNVVPSLPGKQVTTSHGHIFRGTLVAGDQFGIICLKMDDKELTIPMREVVSVDDVDLSVGVREVPLTFDDLKDYVSDLRRPDGLKAQMIATIGRTLRGAGVGEKEIRDYFDRRTVRNEHYEDGRVISEPVYATIHDATYGKGSWLRDGSKPLPLSDNAETMTLRPHNSHATPYANAKPVENPETSDDVNAWFANQSIDTQFNILRAIAAEKVFSAKVVEERCNDCAGTGTVTAPGPGGHPITFRCPTCRGVKVLFRLTYE